MKIFHVLASLNIGGIESWLRDLTIYNASHQPPCMNIYFVLNSDIEKIDFYEREVKEHGAEIYKLIEPKKNLFKYCWQLYKILRKEKPDVVHAHSFYFSGVILLIAALARVKVRIVHSHTTQKSDRIDLKRKIYVLIMRKFIGFFSTAKIAVSEESYIALYGCQSNNEQSIVPCGIDFTLNQNKLKSLDLPFLKNKYVITHVGRFVPEKNHEFIYKIAKRLAEKSVQDVVFLFIGDGPLLSEYKLKFKQLNINSLFLKNRNDVKEILFKYSNIFLFPSLVEGLGLVSLEAQSQGVRCLHSPMIPKEVATTNLVSTRSLDAEVWSQEIFQHWTKRAETENTNYLAILLASKYSIQANYNTILSLYKGIRL